MANLDIKTEVMLIKCGDTSAHLSFYFNEYTTKMCSEYIRQFQSNFNPNPKYKYDSTRIKIELDRFIDCIEEVNYSINRIGRFVGGGYTPHIKIQIPNHRLSFVLLTYANKSGYSNSICETVQTKLVPLISLDGFDEKDKTILIDNCKHYSRFYLNKDTKSIHGQGYDKLELFRYCEDFLQFRNVAILNQRNITELFYKNTNILSRVVL